jgi:predicted porin
MKKQLLGMTTLMAATLSCYAQSSVTLYGTVDDGLTYTNNQGGAHNFQASNGALGSSKWGFQINEDLGADTVRSPVSKTGLMSIPAN